MNPTCKYNCFFVTMVTHVLDLPVCKVHEIFTHADKVICILFAKTSNLLFKSRL